MGNLPEIKTWEAGEEEEDVVPWTRHKSVHTRIAHVHLFTRIQSSTQEVESLFCLAMFIQLYIYI